MKVELDLPDSVFNRIEFIPKDLLNSVLTGLLLDSIESKSASIKAVQKSDEDLIKVLNQVLLSQKNIVEEVQKEELEEEYVEDEVEFTNITQSVEKKVEGVDILKLNEVEDDENFDDFFDLMK